MTTALAPPPGYDLVVTDVAGLQPGDELISFDGHPIRARTARRIAEGPARADGARRMVNPHEPVSGVEWWVYPDQVDEIVVHRARPAKPAPVPATDDVIAALARDVPRIPNPQPARGEPWTGPKPVGGGWIGDDVAVGDVVLVPDAYWRAGVVTKVGPKRVRVLSTSRYALDAHPGGVWAREPYYQRSLVCRAPAAGWTERARRIGAKP